MDSITFDTTGLILEGDRNGVRVWHTPAGDRIKLHYFPLPPDIEADINSIDEIRALYRKGAHNAGAAIIEVEKAIVDGCTAIRTILKVPQQPSGITYLGSLTLPFRDFSYVLRIQCAEVGMTGWREAVVFDRLLGSGIVSSDKNGPLRGWMEDPYEPSATGSFARNKSEAEEYDVDFPAHPLTRSRQTIRRIQHTLKVSEGLKREPKF